MAQKLPKRLPELDIVRALAICIIVAVHSYWFLASGTNSISGQDVVSTNLFRSLIVDLGLALFFFLSGFALYRNNQILSTWHDVIDFFRKRALRIFPLYWLALFVFIICFNALPFNTLAAGYNPVDISYFPSHSVSAILVYVLGFQALLSPQATNEPIRLLWFVGVILVYYAAYPLIVAFSSRITKFIAISALVFLALWALQLVIHTVTPELFLFFGVFVGGILASKYALVDKFILHVSEVSYIAQLTTSTTAAGIQVAGLGALLFFFSSPRGEAASLVLVAAVNALLMLFSFFLVAGVKILATNPRDSSYRLYRLIAYSSYAVYLFHLPLLLMLGFALTYVLNLTVLQTNAVLIFIGVPSMFVVCYLIQALQDVTMKRIVSQRRTKRS